MINPSQIQRLKRDSKELKHYMWKLEKQGKTHLAHKIKEKYEYLSNYITDLEAA
jgi:hypothetical protein